MFLTVSRKGIATLGAILLVSLPPSPVPVLARPTTAYLPEQGELFEQALSEAGLTPEDVFLDAADMALWNHDRYRLKLLDVFFQNPWKISAYTRTLSDRLLAEDRNLTILTYDAHKMLDAGVSLQLDDPLAGFEMRANAFGEDALAVALGELTQQAPAQFKTADYSAVPVEVRQAVAQFLFAAAKAERFRQLALVQPMAAVGRDSPMGRLRLSGMPQALRNRVCSEVMDYIVQTWAEQDAGINDDTLERVLLIESLLDRVDFKLLNAGAILSAIATQALQQRLLQLGTDTLHSNYRYQLDTPSGKILLNGQGQQTYPADDYLLIVDVAGDDTYYGGGGSGCDRGISVILDLAGNDTYDSRKNSTNKTDPNKTDPDNIDPAFGAGIFGYGILLDQQGNDRYFAQFLSQGSGLFGTGILYDVAGDDRYHGIGNLQGSGSFGSGLLIDNQGDDRYEIYKFGQGYGFTQGFGLLLDSNGNDRYIGLENSHPNGGPFGPEHHVHFTQGAALGRRGDYLDGHSWAGGIGLLVDGAGRDRYECEIYCMGTGYWYALGILTDKTGDDRYNGGWYSLGSAPHFALGIHQDGSGDDRYSGIMAQSLGNGRDWSIGWFEDVSGNDWYQGSFRTFGTGDANGIGIFWDRTGNDTYLAFEQYSHGQSIMESAGSLRDLMLTLGLFIDGQGQDTYLLLPQHHKANGLFQGTVTETTHFKPHPFIRDRTTWCRPTQKNQVPGAYGCGLDAPQTAPQPKSR